MKGEFMLEFVLNFLFPPICGICGKINKNWLCENCEKSLNRIKKTEIIIPNELREHKEEKKYSVDYLKYSNEESQKLFYDSLLYMFEYKGIIRQLILKYKFRQKAYLYNMFSRIILKDEKILSQIKSYDVIIPIPMFKEKKKRRGYNQTELITKLISKELNINLQDNNLIKIKNTKTQSTLSRNERKENIKNAFFVNNKEEVENKRIIIFDDIFTTGETVNEASRILKKVGAKEILVFVVAKD